MAAERVNFSSISAPLIFSGAKLSSHPKSFLPYRSNIRRTKLSGLRIAYCAGLLPKPTYDVSVSAKLEDLESELPQEPESGSSSQDGTLNINLPRRSLLVQFTCNGCGERTQRMLNRIAYERGTVFVQCAGCLQHHKLVDNLGLVVEYDLREDMGSG